MKTSKTTRSLLIDEPNLSTAWARAFLQIIDGSGKRIAPLALTVRGFENGQPFEDAGVRAALDTALVALGQQEVHTVANTIFPSSVWRFSRGDRGRFYETYLKNVPRYVALARSKNSRGLYFARLIAYGDGPCEGNQLEYMIQSYTERKGVRTSMFQAAIFNPGRDHIKSAQLGFPCLHSISFVPCDGELLVNAFYPTQQVFEKAYGNYLGLCRLGAFMAEQMGLEMRQLSCFVGVEKLDNVAKSAQELHSLIDACRSHIAEADLAVSGKTA
jgi:hypothetical protein